MKNRIGGFIYGLIWSFAPVTALVVSIDYTLAFLKAPELAKWLNNWNLIEDEMLQLGFNRDKIKITTFSRYFIPLFEFVPSVILGSLELIWIFDIRYPIHCVISIIYAYVPTLCYSVEDSKALLMLKCLQVGFLQVRNHLEKSLNIDRGQIPVRNLHLFLIKLRLQAKQCGDYLATQQLVSILMTMYTTAASCFLFVAVLSDHSLGDTTEELLTMAFASTWPFFGISRLYVKVWMGVRVTNEEKEIASLIKLETLKEEIFGTEYSNELREIYKLLTNHPTEVSFNNYVKLNNPLILGVFQQIFTAFIILMQFRK
ncbi:uncharacterized protein LOC118435768 [Folsomia candida]|uniref:uncharacterized protein LOC118435768 n=1 Tax=Folsomia candida TaxID=158441 RepID=UPI001604B78C|nr:uncharacterized protein LOC118435768 [Folsomia candida]